MRTYALLSALILTTTGCDFRGARFISATKSSVGLAVPEGQIWTIPGNPVLSDGTTGLQQSLLHLLFVCPDMTGITNRGSESSFAPGQNRYTLNWSTTSGQVSVAVNWDKRTDRVIVGGASFGRDTGNVFVVKREPSGRLITTQLPSIDSNARAIDAVRYIRQQLSNDSVISSVRLLEGEP